MKPRMMRFCLPVLLFLAGTPFSQGQVNTERFRIAEARTGLRGLLDIDATFITGNTDFQLLVAEGQVRYGWGESYVLGAAAGGIGWANDARFINRSLVHLRYGYDIDTVYAMEAFIQFDTNKDRKLLFRQLVGGGGRIQVARTSSSGLAVGFAYMLERERIDSTATLPQTTDTNHRLSAYLTYNTKLGSDVTFLTVSYYQPRIDRPSDMRLLSENILTLPFSEHISFSVKLDIRYDSKPPDGIKDIDLTSRFGISLRV